MRSRREALLTARGRMLAFAIAGALILVALTVIVVTVLKPSDPGSTTPAASSSRPSTAPSSRPAAARTVASIGELVPSTINKKCVQLTDTQLQCEKGPSSHVLVVTYQIFPDRKALELSLADKHKTYDKDEGGRLTPGDCSTGTGHYGTFREGNRSVDFLCTRPDKNSGYTEIYWTDAALLASAQAGYYTDTGDHNFDWRELAGQWHGLRLNH